MASVSWATPLIEPMLIAPVAKRFTDEIEGEVGGQPLVSSGPLVGRR
jgi:hypothetical protein